VTGLPDARKALASYLTGFLIRFLARTGITPDTLTWLGFFVAISAVALIVTGHLFAAGFVVLIAGFFDILDGALARSTNRVTPFGGILDSTLDRLAEAVLLIGIMLVYAREQRVAEVLLVGAVLAVSFLVSYIRARAEAAGLECQEGIFTRTERVIVLSLGLLLSRFDYVLTIALGIIGLFSLITVVHRLFHVFRQTKN
jgi:CDP-diacylglycerol--glycerol-3-phosphate 3-phosphatidyltransferase